jgi:hypothetical protein
MQCLADLEALFSAGKIQHCGPITKALLNQILNGAAKHDDMPTGCQNALRQQGLI